MTEEEKKRKLGIVKDHRAAGAARMLYINEPVNGEHRDYLVPEGMTNEVMNVTSTDGVVGDIVIGPDGFIEALFYVGGKIVKLKKYPEEKRVHMRAW